MQLKHLSVLVLFIAIFIAGCQSSTDHGKVKEELLQADRDFSNLSIEKGMNAAFLEYIADDGVLLRPNQMPVVGKDKARELLSRPDSAFSISWEPLFADVSASGELGYTYGIYKVEAKAEDGSPVVS